MKGYTEVTNQNELDTFEEIVDGLVDAIVREVRVLNQSYVDGDTRQTAMGEFDVQIIFQSPNVDHDIEVIICRVELCMLGAWIAEDGMNLSINETGTWPERLIRIGDLCGARLFYRTLPKSTAVRLGPEMPSPEAIPASAIKSKWRQCSNCCDAWEEEPETRFSRCPSCGLLTELRE